MIILKSEDFITLLNALKANKKVEYGQGDKISRYENGSYNLHTITEVHVETSFILEGGTLEKKIAREIFVTIDFETPIFNRQRKAF